MTIEFSDLGLHDELVQAVQDLGYTEPTPIQAKMIPLMLSGVDVIGQAQTGTGKTAAFALPIIHNLDPLVQDAQCLVVAPTRELAMQVARAFRQYGRRQDVNVLAIFGGDSYGRQISRLRRGVDVVVGTPGRLLDLINKGKLDLQSVRTVILDEADEMLSMGFIEDIEAILQETPDTRQTALFSATMPNEIRRLAQRYLQDPQTVSISPKQMTVAAIEQRYYVVNEKDKFAALTRLFEVEEVSRALVFARTRAGSDELANRLLSRGVAAEVLNGDLTQDARTRTLNRFREDQIQVLVATDVAARGLDIDDISHVFNYDLPTDPDSYVHRIGRTGRAGRSGVAISLVTPGERGRLRRIENYAKQRLTVATLPTREEILAQRETQLMTRIGVWLQRDRCRREKEMVVELVEAGHDPLEVAAVALKMARAEEKQRPIPEISKVVEYPSRGNNDRSRGRNGRPQRGHNNGSNRRNGSSRHHRSGEKGMVQLAMSAGRNDGVRPNDVVGTLAYQADIPGNVIGKISIFDNSTMVDVPEQFVGKVLAKDDYRLRRKAITFVRQ